MVRVADDICYWLSFVVISVRVECAFTSTARTECGMFVMYCMQSYVRVSCFVVRGCAVSRRYIMFAIVICLVLLICTLSL